MKPSFIVVSLLLFASCRADQSGGEVVARAVLPGQALATFIPGKEATTSFLKQVTLFLAGPARQGRLVLHLVPVQPRTSVATHELPQPATKELLPFPLVLEPTQLSAAAGGHLNIPLARYHLPLPPQGVFLIVECQPSQATDQVVGVTVAQQPDGISMTQVVLSPTPDDLSTARVVPGAEFPHLLAQLGGETPSVTYLRPNAGAPWQPRPPLPCTLRVMTDVTPSVAVGPRHL